MKKFSVGLCVAAAIALPAVMAPAAQAGQLGKCVKTAKVNKKYTGKYTDKYCTTKASEAEVTEGKKNKYEWEANTKEIATTGEGGESKLNSPAGEITCKKGKSTGKFINATESRVTITFEECTAEPAHNVVVACQSNPSVKGVIVTKELHSKMVDFPEMVTAHNEAGEPILVGPAEKEVWSEVFTESGPSAEFECTLFTVKTFGDVAGVIPHKYIGAKLKAGKAGKHGPGTGKPTFTEEFTKSIGAQGLFSELCGERIKEKDGKECVVVPAYQEGTAELLIPTVEKGLEIDDI